MKYVNIDLDTLIFLIITVLVIAGLLIGLVSTIYGTIKANRLNSEKVEAFNLLLNRYSGNVLDADSVHLIYEEKINKKFDYSYEDFLKSFLIYVTEKNAGNENRIKGIEQIIKPLLQIERTFKPYSKLEEEERQALLAIEAYTKNSGEIVQNSVRYNLDWLSSMMEKKHKMLKTSEIKNKVSYAIGILGVLLTIYSFIRKPSISEESIKNISTEISMQMDSILKQNVYVDTVREFVGNEVAN
jgi:hypothetical protein